MVDGLLSLATTAPAWLDLEILRVGFMRQALIGLLLIAPMTAAMGVLTVHFRMSFFADAVSHSAFAGVALGLLFSVSPHWTMPVFGVLVGVGIMALQRRSRLSTDAAIGVVFSGVVAFGLAMVSRHAHISRDLQRFLYGDILTIDAAGLSGLAALAVVVTLYHAWSYNRLLYIGLHPAMAGAHRVRVAAYQYSFAGLLALVIMVSIWAVGVLLVTALLIVPAATARNLARSARGLLAWALLVSLTSAFLGLILSAQPWANTATGPTIILVACAIFLASLCRRRNQ
ncbi:MAG TPA: metal ABC transporter permease [Kiritimatiellia bacterium]|nr:metal ABC transporter permease [Kiritimatiellia bacterium]